MQLALVRSRAIVDATAPPVQVEVHLANGLPAFTVVGLPEAEVRESRERVRAALVQSGFEFPNRRITVNLAPADLPKHSGRFDLPIAIGVLVASGQVAASGILDLEFVGELSLSGEIRPIRGALLLALAVREAGSSRALMLPSSNLDEARLARGARLLGAPHLAQAVRSLAAGEACEVAAGAASDAAAAPGPELADVRAQPAARRALEIAAAGGHSLLFSGPPGSGKTMLAERLPGLLPPMTETEALESAAVLGLVGRFEPTGWGRRPFRAPHHTASAAALVGGGGVPRPGEISLAHHGVLFLDELPEFDRRVLEVLREPLESGRVTLSRAARFAEYPARFQLVAAMNPCPCGYLGSGRCRCTPDQVLRYRSRISGPLIDRIDIALTVGAPRPELLGAAADEETSATVRARVVAARERQLARQGRPNARLDAADTERLAAPDEAGRTLLARAMARLGLSARRYHRVLRVARSIADLAGEEQTVAAHIAEALQLRLRDSEGSAVAGAGVGRAA